MCRVLYLLVIEFVSYHYHYVFCIGETPSPVMTESQFADVIASNRKSMGRLVWPEVDKVMNEEMEEIDFDSQVI
jgi:hypothetical protein